MSDVLFPPSLPTWRRHAAPGISLAAAGSPRIQAVDSAPIGIAPVIVRPEMRQFWIANSLAVYTPAYIETILRGALGGNQQEQWELFGLMEDTWPRLAKNLNKLKRAVISMNWEVRPWADEDESATPEAEDRAELVSNAVWSMRPRSQAGEAGFEELLFDLLDAWGKGIAVSEIDWEFRDGQIVPRAAWSCPPSTWSINGAGEIGLITGKNWQPFPANKFIAAVARARSGPMGATGLLRPLAWWWCAANFSADWLLNLAQLFGLPFRWASYDPSAPAATIDALCTMLASMGHSGWAAFPAGTQLELKEPSKGSDQYPQANILDRADKQCDLLILGQTLTSDAQQTGTQALGTVHKEVEDEVVLGAAEWLARTLNQQLIPALLRLNYGDESNSPEFYPCSKQQEDAVANANRDATLLDRGVALPREWFYKRHDIPLPAEGDAVITKPQAPAPGASFSPPGRALPSGAADDTEESDEDMPPMMARAAVPTTSMQDLVAQAVADGVGARRRWLAPLRMEIVRLAAIAERADLSADKVAELIEAGVRRLPELFADLDRAAFAKHIEAAMGTATVQAIRQSIAARREG